MSLVTVRIQDATGACYDVPMDNVNGGTYYPIYKLSFGASSAVGTIVSSDDPLPVVIGDGTDSIDVLGEGDAVDRVDMDGTVGTTKGIMSLVVDGEDEARLTKATRRGHIDIESTELRGMFCAMLLELKKVALHLSLMTDTSITDGEV